MSSPARNLKTFDLIRGDKWDGVDVELTVDDQPTFDFTGTVARAQLREEKDGAKTGNVVIYDFSPIAVDTSTLGIATFTLSIEGAQTEPFPEGLLYGDVEVTAPAGLGPYTVAQFAIRVAPDVTR